MSKVETIKARQGKLKQALIEQLRRLPLREAAYDKVGVTRMTVSRWRKASQKFADEMDAAISEGYEFICGMAESQQELPKDSQQNILLASAEICSNGRLGHF